MKPRQFVYHAPSSLPEILDLLAAYPYEAKLLAGGQSLMPLLNFRLAAPEHLIDINRLPGLDAPTRVDGGWRVPALVRQRSLERSADLTAAFPMLSTALQHVAHPQIRNRGTVCGSLAHADPAAELPTVMTALDATFHAVSKRGERAIASGDFFQFHFTTTLRDDELLAGVTIPDLAPGTVTAFAEYAPRRGDFGLAGVAGVATLDEGGVVSACRFAASGVGPTPQRLIGAEAVVLGRPLTAELARAAQEAAQREVDPSGDVHAPAAYRKHLVGSLMSRVVRSMQLSGQEGQDVAGV